MKNKLLIIAVIVFLTPLNSYAQKNITWESWSIARFDEAKKQNKLLILNLEAVWCHWCHVMEKETYSKPEVIDLINKSYIPVKVDQDSFPDLSLRYRDYGWPATIIFNSKGEELNKLSGYIEAPEFIKILNESVKNPQPKDKGGVDLKYNDKTVLDKDYKENLTNKHYSSLDNEIGGLKTSHRYLDFETMEYSLINAASGSQKDTDFAKLTLKANLNLIDPVWGGAYQYSTKFNWINPHYEKIMRSQSDNMKLYSYAYSLWGEESSWSAATNIYRYVKSFLTSTDGAFYTSQDADLVKGQHSESYFALTDAERKKLGTPSVDKNIYSRENGWMISSLCALYSATGNQAILDDAIKSAEWINSNRPLPEGGFKHGEKDSDGPFLGDTLSMSQAFLDLYAASANKKWLELAESSAGFAIKNFSDSNAPGYFSSKDKTGNVLKPFKDLNENIQLTRLLNLLSHYTGKSNYKTAATSAMQYVSSPAIASDSINNSGILTADLEFNKDPLHITVVGNKDDPTSKELYLAGLKYFSVYKRIEWWDKREGSMPNPDVEYPQMQKPAAFICTNKRCSLPIFKAEGVSSTIKMFQAT